MTAPESAGPARACEICGRTPAVAIHASKYTGRVLLGDEIFWKGDACAPCATSLCRDGLTHCLWAGWWAPVALVANPVRIGRNLRGLRAAAAVGEPQGPAFAPPLEPGPPLWRRPLAWIGAAAPIVVAVAIVALVAAIAGGGRLDELRAGQCLELPPGSTVERAGVVDCDGPHDAEVSGLIAAGSVPPLEALCGRQTTAYLGSPGPVDGLSSAAIRYEDDDDTRIVCLIIAVDGSPLEGSHRGAGG